MFRDGFNSQDVPLGDQRITSLSSSTALTVPNGTRFAIVTVETQPVRYRDSGTPTTSVGTLLNPGDVLEYTGDFSAIRFIETAASASIFVQYYR